MVISISQVYSWNNIRKTQRPAHKCSTDSFISFIVIIFITHSHNREKLPVRLGFLQNNSFPQKTPNETSSFTYRSDSLMLQSALSSEKAVESPPGFQPLRLVLSPDVPGIRYPDSPSFIKHRHSHQDRSLHLKLTQHCKSTILQFKNFLKSTCR